MSTINDTIIINVPKNKKQYIYINDYVYKEGNGYTIQTYINVSDKKDELLEEIAEKNKEFQNYYNSLSPKDKGIIDTIMRQRK